MTISEDKTTLNFVLDKSLKYKLQILADADDKKLGAYVAFLLENHVVEFEKNLLRNYSDSFEEMYHYIFGHEFETYLNNYESHIDEEDEKNKKKIINSLKNL
jgi:hypothetical protein